MRLGTLVIAALVVAAGAAAQNAPVPVPSGDYLASELTSGTLFVLSPSGREVWSVPRPIADYGAEGIALTKDRRVAYVSVLRRDDQPPNLYAVDLSTGAKRVVARGVDPALSPDGAKLAYHHTVLARVGDYWVIDGLAIPDEAKARLKSLTPATYVGLAAELARRV